MGAGRGCCGYSRGYAVCFPVKAQYAYTRLYSYSGQSFDNMIKNVYDKLKDGTHLDSGSTSKLLSDTDFDMTKSENYLRVEMVFDLQTSVCIK